MGIINRRKRFIHFLSPDNIQIIGKMETVLQLCESRDSYPIHFQEFLDNCIEKYPNFTANDYLFSAVYFIIVECGFFPSNLYDDYPYLFTDTFDIRKLRFIKSYENEHMKFVQNREYCVYRIPLRLGNYRSDCELHGVPSAENNTYLIINFLLKQSGTVKSLCLSTENYIEKNECPSKHSLRLKNMNELSILIKDEVSMCVKETIMLNEGQGCCPNLLRLPEDIQETIIYYLISNAVDVQYLASTCSYFYNIITNDFKLWEILCLSEFEGRVLNEALHHTLESHESQEPNLFRKVFLDLKEKGLRRGYRFF